jgi:hypothetical protein
LRTLHAKASLNSFSGYGIRLSTMSRKRLLFVNLTARRINAPRLNGNPAKEDCVERKVNCWLDGYQRRGDCEQVTYRRRAPEHELWSVVDNMSLFPERSCFRIGVIAPLVFVKSLLQ